MYFCVTCEPSMLFVRVAITFVVLLSCIGFKVRVPISAVLAPVFFLLHTDCVPCLCSHVFECLRALHCLFVD